MTVIACRDGVIAADRMVSTTNDLIVGYRTKIWSVDGMIFGTCGLTEDGNAFKKWVEDGRPESKPALEKEFLVLLVEPDGSVVHYHGALVPISIEGKYFAIGNGDQAAMGAMWMGASAEQAVQAACAHVFGCGGGVDVVALPTAVPPSTAAIPPTAGGNQSTSTSG